MEDAFNLDGIVRIARGHLFQREQSAVPQPLPLIEVKAEPRKHAVRFWIRKRLLKVIRSYLPSLGSGLLQVFLLGVVALLLALNLLVMSLGSSPSTAEEPTAPEVLPDFPLPGSISLWKQNDMFFASLPLRLLWKTRDSMVFVSLQRSFTHRTGTIRSRSKSAVA
jgi:hypothetical protein